MAAARSAIMIVGAVVVPLATRGMIEASATRNPAAPWGSGPAPPTGLLRVSYARRPELPSNAYGLARIYRLSEQEEAVQDILWFGIGCGLFLIGFAAIAALAKA